MANGRCRMHGGVVVRNHGNRNAVKHGRRRARAIAEKRLMRDMLAYGRILLRAVKAAHRTEMSLARQALADARSLRAASHTSQAAPAFNAAMPNPTIKSGQAETQRNAVTSPAPTIAKLAAASLRADRNAAVLRLPPECRTRANKNAHPKFTVNAPNPANVKGKACGATDAINFAHALHSVAKPGTRMITANANPMRARATALHAKANAINRVTAASSRKSMLSANNDTEPIANATANSMPKYTRFAAATMRTMRFSAWDADESMPPTIKK
jgi:hypothetical protein